LKSPEAKRSAKRRMSITEFYYTQKWLRIRSKTLGSIYYSSLVVIICWLFISLALNCDYVERHRPHFDVHFWQEQSEDGDWWPQHKTTPKYCGSSFYWGDTKDWGSNSIGCKHPEKEDTTFFYSGSNVLKVATSIAFGDEWNSKEIYFYQDIERASVAFQVSYWTPYETRDVLGCGAKLPNGSAVVNRYAYGTADGDKILAMSLRDILAAANKTFDDVGSEGAILRLQGIEIVAEITVQNYQQPFDWQGKLQCDIAFRVLRDQFTQVKQFYNGTSLLALQHGVRLRAIGNGSVGYPSFRAALSTIVVGLALLQMATTVVDNIAYYLHPKKTIINEEVCDELDIDSTEMKKKQ